MSMRVTLPAALVAGLMIQSPGASVRAQALTPLNTAIQTVVVIYEENRSFDNLFGRFPGANGLQNVTAAQYQQFDRNGNVKGGLLPTLPPVWGGLTNFQSNAPQGQPIVTQAQTAGMANKPFSLDGASGYLLSRNVITRDLYHRFYENQMQIDGGKNDMFAAWADSGGLVMGYWDGSTTNLWKYAQQNVLADNFFLPAFGGSFLNHQYLIAAQPPVWQNCTPGYSATYSNAAPNNNNNSANTVLADYTIQPNPSAVQADGTTLTVAANSPASALNGPPTYMNSSTLTAAGCYLINTDQPAFQPSSVAKATAKTYVNPAITANPSLYANPANSGVVPPQLNMTIGDELSAAGVNWAWYSGAFGCTLAGTCTSSTTANGAAVPDFQYHHQPFNYFESFAPGTPARAAHLLDGGLQGAGFISAINGGQVANGVFFYKPEGDQNWHNGYDDITDADAHLAAVVSALQASPAYAHMMIVITFDENGGFWDHVAPPKADQFGPGTRIPAVIISPFAKKAFVDHTQYDQSSIMRFVQRRWNLQKLPGETLRDTAVAAANTTAAMKTIGDLTNALSVSLPAVPAVPAVCVNATNTAVFANTTGAACPTSTVSYPPTH